MLAILSPLFIFSDIFTFIILVFRRFYNTFHLLCPLCIKYSNAIFSKRILYYESLDIYNYPYPDLTASFPLYTQDLRCPQSKEDVCP